MPQTHRARARQDAIKHLREAKGWGQQALADKALVSIKTVSSIENGNPAHLSTFGKIAKALGVEPAAFLYGYDAATRLPSATQGTDSKRVQLTLTLSMPYEDFDETEGLDRLVGVLTSLVNAKNAITITDLSPGSVKVTMLVDEEDAPRLVQAFAQHKLDAVQATELDVPRASVLYFLAGHVAQGVANPILVPVLPFVGFWLLLKHLRNSGISVEAGEGDQIRLKRTTETSPPSTDTASSPLAYADPALIRQAIEFVTPEVLAPSFPYKIGLRLEPTEAGDLDPIRLGEQLESRLLHHEPLRGKVSRAAPGPGWTGELSLEVTSIDDVRAMTEVVLTSFLGHPVTLVTTQEGARTFLGLKFKMSGEVTTNLDTKVLVSAANELAKVLGKL